MNNWIHTIGFLSAVLTTTSFLPQAIKTWKTRSTHDLSPLMFTLFTIGIAGWLIYGILINDLPMILANSVTIVLAGTIMFFIIRGKTTVRVAHLGIYVDNLDTMSRFYSQFFGAVIGKKYHNPDKKFTSCFLSFPSGIKIELMHVTGRKADSIKNQWGHIAVSLKGRSEVDEFIQNIKNKGIEIISAPRVTGDGYYESIISDPEGNYIEITE